MRHSLVDVPWVKHAAIAKQFEANFGACSNSRVREDGEALARSHGEWLRTPHKSVA
jgi:hypothetical protein